jgi:hypothetical protein
MALGADQAQQPHEVVWASTESLTGTGLASIVARGRPVTLGLTSRLPG